MRNNKTLILSTFLSLLIVGCSNAPSSLSSSNFTLSSGSSSSTSNEEPINERKVPFNQIGSLVAQVVDAKAMGIVNSKERTQLNRRRNAQGEDQNYMVKVTETYNPNTEITEDQTIKVTFSRVTNTQTTVLQTGTESYVASAEPLTIERLTDLPGNIVITNVEGYEYRLLSEDVVIQDWLSGELETIEFIFDEELPDITIESRSLNASISFIAFAGFTYTIKQGETILYEGIEDNDEPDTNEALGNITLSGLTEGLTYDVTYAGYQVIETITQDEVEGQVDKLYVLYQYTFISFVPLTINQRPQDQDLELDYDDVPLYDKQGYFSDSTRQSFVVNNDTGLIYKIENINIASLSGGCVAVQDSPFPFDMKINLNDELEFYSLHQNSAINTYKCFKDSYGNRFISNDKINFYDENNKTTYFVYIVGGQEPASRPFNYFPTSKGEVIKLEYESNYSNLYKKTVKIWLNQNGSYRELNSSDNFLVYHNIIAKYWRESPYHDATTPYKVQNGEVFFGMLDGLSGLNWGLFSRFYGWFYLGVFMSENNEYRSIYNNDQVNQKYFVSHDLVIHFFGQKLYYLSSATAKLKEEMLNSNYDFDDIFLRRGVLLIEDATFPTISSVSKVTLQGILSYDLILKNIDGEWGIQLYPSGTYVVPPSITITLQPINR